jgi:hypothetical protein
VVFSTNDPKSQSYATNLCLAMNATRGASNPSIRKNPFMLYSDTAFGPNGPGIRIATNHKIRTEDAVAASRYLRMALEEINAIPMTHRIPGVVDLPSAEISEERLGPDTVLLRIGSEIA